MSERSAISITRFSAAIAMALLLLSSLGAPSFGQVSEDAMRQCERLTNTVRRATCYDLLVKLHVTEPIETTGQGDAVTIRLDPEQLSKLDAWISVQREKPSRTEAVRRLLDSLLTPPPR